MAIRFDDIGNRLKAFRLGSGLSADEIANRLGISRTALYRFEKGELAKFKSRYNGKSWAELTAEEHQKFPGDTEAQVGQGPITFHSEEHLMSSDQGVGMLRFLLQKQVDAVAAGGDPVGVAFNEKDAYVKFDAGQYLED